MAVNFSDTHLRPLVSTLSRLLFTKPFVLSKHRYNKQREFPLLITEPSVRDNLPLSGHTASYIHNLHFAWESVWHSDNFILGDRKLGVR